MRFPLACLPLAAACTLLAGCIQDESAPNRLGMERPALQPNTRNQDDAEKRAIEKPQRELPTGRTEFPGQSMLTTPSSVLTLDAASTQPADAPAAKVYTINDNKNQATPGHDIPVPGTTSVIDKTWGQIYPLPTYPHRDWAVSTTTYYTGGVPGNPTIFHNIWPRPDYQPKHPYGTAVGIGADALEIPYFVGEVVALPVLYLMDCPYRLNTFATPSGDPNYNGYLPPTTNLVPAPYPGHFQFESATQPSTAAEDTHPVSKDLPPVPVRP